MGFLNWAAEEFETVCSECGGEGKVEVPLSPVFEVWMTPKDPESSIVRLVARIDDPKNLYDLDTVATFIETQFPMYTPDHIIAGYKQVISTGSDATPELDQKDRLQ